ncbi:PLP-dependent cysteine synthase family protein [Brucella intermedia]|uniref:PLP-dependent cysteine synthase family protein n=1 Tax=Brucella intermedia TaxID=94625 RepID=UPI00235F604B|nr:pyridoxal-phosphate dependent enzyme [Brucella intermedia]
MPQRKVLDSISQLERPRIIQLRPNLFACCFQLMKLLPARFMLDRAEDRGELCPGNLICETTSGTFGLALAKLGAIRGYSVKLISDPAVDPYLATRLKALGADVEIVAKPSGGYGFQGARLSRLHEVLDKNHDAYWPNQYDNPDNPLSYSVAAEHLAEIVGQVDCLVGSVGSGGSMSGTARFLRDVFPALHVSGVDTHGSVLFGQPDGPRTLRGLGNSIIPGNLDYSQFDDVHWVTAVEALAAMRTLHIQHGLFMGPTSGASVLVADWLARTSPDKIVVAMLADEGHRYYQTAYNDTWLASLGGETEGRARNPITISSPLQASDQWSRYRWGRRDRDHYRSSEQRIAS